jgi:hypothetical protein
MTSCNTDFMKQLSVFCWLSCELMLDSAQNKQHTKICHSLTVLKTSQELNVNTETMRLLLTEDLNVNNVCAKMVPRKKSMSSSDRLIMWQSGKRKQRLEEGTMWSKRQWKLWGTRKLVPTGFASCWQRSTNFKKKKNLPTITGIVCSWRRLSSQNCDRLWRLVSSLQSGKRMRQHGMALHNTAKEKGADNNLFSLWGHANCLLGCWKMCISKVFGIEGNHQCCSLPLQPPETLSPTVWR